MTDNTHPIWIQHVIDPVTSSLVVAGIWGYKPTPKERVVEAKEKSCYITKIADLDLGATLEWVQAPMPKKKKRTIKENAKMTKLYIVMTDKGLVSHLQQSQNKEDLEIGRVLRVLPFKPNDAELHGIMQSVFGSDLKFNDAIAACWVLEQEVELPTAEPIADTLETMNTQNIYILTVLDPHKFVTVIAGMWGYSPSVDEQRRAAESIWEEAIPLADLHYYTQLTHRSIPLEENSAVETTPVESMSTLLQHAAIIEDFIERKVSGQSTLVEFADALVAYGKDKERVFPETKNILDQYPYRDIKRLVTYLYNALNAGTVDSATGLPGFKKHLWEQMGVLRERDDD